MTKRCPEGPPSRCPVVPAAKEVDDGDQRSACQ
jgi:hypothetical protein